MNGQCLLFSFNHKTRNGCAKMPPPSPPPPPKRKTIKTNKNNNNKQTNTDTQEHKFLLTESKYVCVCLFDADIKKACSIHGHLHDTRILT